MPGSAWSSALLAALALCGACTIGPVGASIEEIVGGTDDPGDPGVVLMIAQQPGSQSSALCTAEVISPHVVLTAAHCVHPLEVGATTKFVVYPGTDLAQANQGNTLAVKEAHANPAWNPNDFEAGHDSGVLILVNPIAIAPLPYNRDVITAAQKNQAVRFVGYGVTSAAATGSAGKKRQTSAVLTDYDSTKLFVADTIHNTCSGDSGGPVFQMINGKETIIGLTSYGDEACAQGGFYTRVDAELSFVDPYVLANDPPAPAPGSASPVDMANGAGGDPPTSSASPEQVGDAGTERVRKPPAEDAGLPGCSFAAQSAPRTCPTVALFLLGCALASRLRRRSASAHTRTSSGAPCAR